MRVLLTYIRTSAWAPILGRALLGAGALVVLGLVGAFFGGPPKTVRVPSLAPAVQALDGLPLQAAITEIDARPLRGAPPDAGAAPPPPAPPPPASSGPRGRATPDTPVHLNEADETELRRLPGVGAKRAEAILALRQRLGRFKRIEELLRVKGVGRATLRKWRPLVRLEPPAPAPPTA